MDPRPATGSRAELVTWLGIADADSAGFIHGGTVMKLCDEAAALAAVKHSRCRVVTAAMDRMTTRTAVPPLLVESADEPRRERDAQTRRRTRLAERDEIVALRGR